MIIRRIINKKKNIILILINKIKEFKYFQKIVHCFSLVPSKPLN